TLLGGLALLAAYGWQASQRVVRIPLSASPAVVYRVSPDRVPIWIALGGAVVLLALAMYRLWRPPWLILDPTGDRHAKHSLRLPLAFTVLAGAAEASALWLVDRSPLIGGDQRFLQTSAILLLSGLTVLAWVPAAASAERRRWRARPSKVGALLCP